MGIYLSSDCTKNKSKFCTKRLVPFPKNKNKIFNNIYSKQKNSLHPLHKKQEIIGVTINFIPVMVGKVVGLTGEGAMDGVKVGKSLGVGVFGALEGNFDGKEVIGK